MRRVELVTRVDRDKCQKFGGTGVWDKLRNGDYPDVSMGCVPAGTRVTLADGTFREMERMQEADVVLTHRGREARVDQLHRYRYKGTLYKFKAYGFQRELPLTANHPLWLVRAEQLDCTPTGNNKGRKQRHCTPMVKERSIGCSGCGVVPRYAFEWVRADEAEVGDYLAFPVPAQDDSVITDVQEAKLLGYYLAEGFVGNYNDRPLEQITFCLDFKEKELAEEIEALGRSLGAGVVWHHETPDRGARTVSLVSKRLAERCLHFCGSGAKTKQLSRDVLYMKPELQLAFLGAYLDGDGGTYKGSAYFSTASEQLAQQLFIVLARCEMIASINRIEHKPSEHSVVQKDTTEFQVWVGTDFSALLGKYTRKLVRASKKIRGQRFFYEYEGVKYLMSPIEEIVEEDYDDDVFNISVAGDDSYLGERLATHNTKVPFDGCSICLDWDLYRQALQTYTPGKQPHPGAAVLAFHKKLKSKNNIGIRGLSITRADYCEHAKKLMNKILPDGRKVWVYNDFPRFFDISFVFIGADKTAKVMLFLGRGGAKPSAEIAEELGVSEPKQEGEKTASIEDETLKFAFLGKRARVIKRGEIKKDVVPSQFAGKAIPLLTKREEDIPTEMLDSMAKLPFAKLLSTLGGMGVVLKPKEFQRITIIQIGKKPLAEELDRKGVVFPKVDDEEKIDMSSKDFSPSLARLLLPLLAIRSALGPFIEQRLVSSGSRKEEAEEKKASVYRPSSHTHELLRKIGGAYNGYRREVMNLVAEAQPLLGSTADAVFCKTASYGAEELFTPLTVHYLKDAFVDEFGDIGQEVVEVSKQASSRRGEGIALREHVETSYPRIEEERS